MSDELYLLANIKLLNNKSYYQILSLAIFIYLQIIIKML